MYNYGPARRTSVSVLAKPTSSMKGFGVNSAFNAEVFAAAPHAVAMEFDLFGEGGVVIGLRAAGQQKGTSGWLARSRNAQSQA